MDPILELTTPEQVAMLGDRMAMDIINRLRTHGPLTVSDLAKYLKRPASGVTYHVKRLAELGLIRESGSRGSKGTPYGAVASNFVVTPNAPRSEEMNQVMRKVRHQLWKHALEDLEVAAEHPSEDISRAISFSRLEGELSPEDQKHYWDLLKQLQELFAQAGKKGGKTKRYRVTVVGAPLGEPEP